MKTFKRLLTLFTLSLLLISCEKITTDVSDVSQCYQIDSIYVHTINCQGDTINTQLYCVVYTYYNNGVKIGEKIVYD